MTALVELGEDDRLVAHGLEPRHVLGQVVLARRQGQQQAGLHRGVELEEVPQPVDVAGFRRVLAGRVHEDEVPIRQFRQGHAEGRLVGGHLDGDLHDPRVGLELLRRGDPVGVRRDEAHLLLLLESRAGRDLGQGRRLARPGGPHEGADPLALRTAVGQADGHGQELLGRAAERRLVLQLPGREVAVQGAHEQEGLRSRDADGDEVVIDLLQAPGELFLALESHGVEEGVQHLPHLEELPVGEGPQGRFGQHRLDLLQVAPQRAGRRLAPVAGRRGRRPGRRRGLFGGGPRTRPLVYGGGHLEQRDPPAAELTRREHHGIRPELVLDLQQGFLRAGGFETLDLHGPTPRSPGI
ncbi:MAG: hypothetical protein A4E67_01243 [Syntrophaceae bacterium PtaB.Bin038]|nr:MAG: hypothetical protein A4E67_01243 [Syntrophaceae bacterium PtaB.Bin038]